MNAEDYVEAVRDLVNDPGGSGYSQSQILRHVSNYAETFFARARCANEEIFTVFVPSLLSESDFVADASNPAYAYALFDNHVVTNITGAWMRRGNSREILRHVNARGGNYYTGESSSGDYDYNAYSATQYDVVGNRFELYGGIPGAFDVEVSYERIPPALFVATILLADVDGSGNARISIAHATNPTYGKMERVPGRYIGTRIQSISGGIETIREVMEHTVTATETTFVIRGAAVELATGTKFATIPALPEDFHHLLALGGACQAAGVRGASKLYSMLLNQRDDAMRQAIVLLEQRLSEPRYVQDTD